jgi:hypothetical protein
LVEAGLNPSGSGSTCGTRPGWADAKPQIIIAVIRKTAFFMLLRFLCKRNTLLTNPFYVLSSKTFNFRSN